MNTLILTKLDSCELSGVEGDTIAGNGASVALVIGRNDEKAPLMQAVTEDVKRMPSSMDYGCVDYENIKSIALLNEPELIKFVRALDEKHNKPAQDIIQQCFSAVLSGFDGFVVKGDAIYAASTTKGGERKVKDLDAPVKGLFSTLMQLFVVENGFVVIKGYQSVNAALAAPAMKAIFELTTLNKNRVVIETDELITVKAFEGADNVAYLTTVLAWLDTSNPKNCKLFAEIEHDAVKGSTLLRHCHLD